MTANQSVLLKKINSMLGFPHDRCDLDAQSRGTLDWGDILVEKWIWTSEPGSKVPAVLYRPKNPQKPMPAIVITCGHGGSKSHWQYTYVPQLYAKLGVATLVLDPIGEEERHIKGWLGTRAHDPEHVHLQADQAGRLIMGKLVYDTLRGIDFLCSRVDIDSDKIGVAGNSLGGAKSGWVMALDERVKLALVSGWTFDDSLLTYGKFCTRIPNQRLRAICTWEDYISLAQPHCAVLVLNGDADVVIDKEGDGHLWKKTRQLIDRLKSVFWDKKTNSSRIDYWFENNGGHRPYHGYPIALEWINRYLGTPGWSLEKIKAIPPINGGVWCDKHHIRLEKLYGTDLHDRGCTLPDMDIIPVPREALACLTEDEIGDPMYTIEGWLNTIS